MAYFIFIVISLLIAGAFLSIFFKKDVDYYRDFNQLNRELDEIKNRRFWTYKTMITPGYKR